MGQQLLRCEALVMRHIDYGEADRILTLFTPEFGLRKGFARSGRKSQKRFGPAIEPFSQAFFYCREGRGAMWSLQEAELISSRRGLQTDFDCLSLASYGVELVELLLADEEPHVQVFELLSAFLDHLAAGGDQASSRLLYELRLVYLLGYMPHLLHCSECLRVFTRTDRLRFDVVRGGSLCNACASGRGDQIDLGTAGSLARTLRVSHRQFKGFSFGMKTLQEANVILSAVLNSILPREPKSLKFLR